MLDIKYIRDNKESAMDGLRKKKCKADIGKLIDLDEKRRELIQRSEHLKAEQNEASKKIAKLFGAEKKDEIEKMSALKEKLSAIEDDLSGIQEEISELMRLIPNLPQDDVPEGKDEKDNVVLREVGDKTKFGFAPKDYLTIAQNLDIIDVERAGIVSGSRFGYLKNEAALLEFALTQLAFSVLLPQGFKPIVPPVMIKKEMMQGMGYVDTPEDEEERYYFEKDKLYLVGTSEQSVGPMHSGEILCEKDLPVRYAAFSSCFRREAGSYGKDTKGILRVHQFDKVEMFSFCRPDDSRDEHALFLKMEEKLMQALKIPYRVVQLCAGDLSRPSATTIDIETWLPGQNEGKGLYREVSSTSNTTDFQSRRLNVKYRDASGKTNFVHNVNGTGAAIGRMIIAIIENYQTPDGFVKIPEVLKPWMHGIEIIKR